MSCKIRIVNYKESFKIVNENNGKLEQICIVTEKWGEELDNDVYQKIKKNNDYFYQFLEQLIQILQILSENRIIHRELTPQNFRIQFVEQNLYLKLISFGVSKQIDITKRNQGTSDVGSINYMASEVIEGIKYGFDVDVYTVGVLLLGILLGESWQYFNFGYNLQSKQLLLKEMKDSILEAQENLKKNREYEDWVYELVSQMIEFNSIDKFNEQKQKENPKIKTRINIYKILDMQQFQHLKKKEHFYQYDEEKNNKFKCEY
ncbi:Protein kinase-like domain [Pseudocohnilembus persalinus]|uniref:Protein kinase-like domain n=1 Tax=Pseudocohnilembus persalinus TaxID=266149 RepID=A0A0V0R3J6_PSEPJ|nr:Protein kinase-like domain [Pseudocohnilembus persalinus]|eukprot:KRX08938.1 Protein kinase-like domain [Pseudocohnilembus persalinus]